MAQKPSIRKKSSTFKYFLTYSFIWIVAGAICTGASLDVRHSKFINDSQILREFSDIFTPWVADRGGRFTLDVNEDKFVLAKGDRRKEDIDNFIVQVNTGLLELPDITVDGLRLLLCHEMGHLLGEEPYRKIPAEYGSDADFIDKNGKPFFTCEGQADWWATNTCMKVLLNLQDEESLNKRAIDIHPKVTERCQKKFSSKKDQLICQLSAHAGLFFLQMGFKTKDFGIQFGFDFEAKERPRQTIDGEYPSRQCRLDTILAGAATPRGEEGRPACWYVPTSSSK